MDVQKIKDLRDQAQGMELTHINMGEAFRALCEIVIALAEIVNGIEREVDDLETYRMEQNERRD